MTNPEVHFEEMRDAVIFAGGQKGPFEPRPDWLTRAAAVLGIEPSRAARYFYRKARNIPSWEADQIRARIHALQQRQEAIDARIQQNREAIARGRSALASGTPEQQRGQALPPRVAAHTDRGGDRGE